MRTRGVQLGDGSWVEIPTATAFDVKACGEGGRGNAHVLLKDETGALFAELTLTAFQAHQIAMRAREIADFAREIDDVEKMVRDVVGSDLDIEDEWTAWRSQPMANLVHELKCWPPHFGHLLDGRKRFEVRLNDRNFRVGDTIKFREWLHSRGGWHDDAHYTGRNLWMRVRYVLNPRPDFDPVCGLLAGYVVLDVEPINEVEARRSATA